MNINIKMFFLVISALAFAAVIIYTFNNHNSSRVLSSFATAMMVAVIGFAANEAISNKTEKFSREFPVVVFYSLVDYRPLNINLPYSHYLNRCTQTIKPSDIPQEPEKYANTNFDRIIYLDALQYILITSTFDKFTMGWNTKTRRIQNPSGGSLHWSSSDDIGKEISFAKFMKENLPNNYFVKLGPNHGLPTPMGDKVILPPDTDIQIATKGNGMLMTLKNKFISMKIEISWLSGSQGIGEYSKLLGGEPSFPTRNLVYLLNVSYEQNYWYNGHPEMEKYKNWADSIAEHLDAEFNFDVIRENHRKSFLLFGSGSIRRL